MVIQKLDEKLMKNENFQKTKFWATRIDINLYCFEYKVHISKIKCRTSVHTFFIALNFGDIAITMWLADQDSFGKDPFVELLWNPGYDGFVGNFKRL